MVLTIPKVVGVLLKLSFFDISAKGVIAGGDAVGFTRPLTKIDQAAALRAKRAGGVAAIGYFFTACGAGNF